MKYVLICLSAVGIFMAFRRHIQYLGTLEKLKANFPHLDWDKENPIKLEETGKPDIGMRLNAKPEPAGIRESRIEYNTLIHNRNEFLRTRRSWAIFTIFTFGLFFSF